MFLASLFTAGCSSWDGSHIAFTHTSTHCLQPRDRGELTESADLCLASLTHHRDWLATVSNNQAFEGLTSHCGVGPVRLNTWRQWCFSDLLGISRLQETWIFSDEHYRGMLWFYFVFLTFESWSPFTLILLEITAMPFSCETQAVFCGLKISPDPPLAWWWGDNDWILIFGWTIPLRQILIQETDVTVNDWIHCWSRWFNS